MRYKTYANRGRPLEDHIRDVNEMYRRKQIAIIDKLPTEFIPLRDGSGRICDVKVEHRSKVDFIGRYKHYPIAIEAKSTSQKSIRFDEVQPHQADYMDEFTAQAGTIGLVLVSFNLQTFYAIPWSFWGAAYDLRVRKNDKTTGLRLNHHGQEWCVPLKFSVKEDELNPEWQVPAYDYLKNAENYVISV